MSGQSRGRRPVEEITDPQRRTLRALRRLTNRQGFPPTIQELADILEISSPSVRDQVKQLIRKGYVKRESETLEFKHTTGTRHEAAQTMCAMLNQRGRNLADIVGEVPISACAKSKSGYDKAKLENGVLEPLRELGLIKDDE